MPTRRGGKRPNSGRKKGTPNKSTQAMREVLAQAGERTPLEFLMQVMNAPAPTQLEGESMKVYLLRYRVWADQSFEAAKAAAPYYHPRLASVEQTGKDGGPIQHKIIVEIVG
jgi:hypothetical protein